MKNPVPLKRGDEVPQKAERVPNIAWNAVDEESGPPREAETGARYHMNCGGRLNTFIRYGSYTLKNFRINAT